MAPGTFETVTLNIGRMRPAIGVSMVRMLGAISIMVYCMMASRGSALKWALAARVDAAIPSSRSRGSSMSVPRVLMMKVTCVPVPSSSAGRTDTGMPAVSDFAGSLPSSSRNRRRAPPQIDTTTSFSVQFPAFASALRRFRSNSCVATRRWPPIRPFSTDRGASNGSFMAGSVPPGVSIDAKLRTSCGTDRTCEPTASTSVFITPSMVVGVGAGRSLRTCFSRLGLQKGGRVRLFW